MYSQQIRKNALKLKKMFMNGKRENKRKRKRKGNGKIHSEKD